MTEHIFDIHGLVGLRVVGTDADVALVRRQVGPLPDAASPRPADLTIRFVDELVCGPLTLLGRREFAFDTDELVVLRGKHKTPVRVRLPLASLQGGEVVVQRGAPSVPYLVALLNLLVLGNGGLALHAAAFEHRGAGVVVTGWSKGGKTECLLAMLGAGARYVGDEWILLDGEGRMAGGLAEPVRVWDWYLAQLPTLRRTVPCPDRLRLAALRVADGAVDAIAERCPIARVRRVAGRAAHAIDGQRHVDLAADRLNRDGSTGLRVRFDVLVHAVSTASPDHEIVAIDPAEVADRMAASLAYERRPLLDLYDAYRYAFPGRRCALIESATSIERLRLRQLFTGRPTFELRHPYPPHLDRLRRLLDGLEPLAPACAVPSGDSPSSAAAPGRAVQP